MNIPAKMVRVNIPATVKITRRIPRIKRIIPLATMAPTVMFSDFKSSDITYIIVLIPIKTQRLK